MKKIISTILSVCLLLSFAGCTGAMKFDSQNEMVSHLKGIWEYEDNYYIISEDKIISTSDYSISDIMEDYFASVIMNDNGDFSSLKAEETLMYVQNKLDEYQGETFYYSAKKGKIVFDNGKESQKDFIVVEEGLEYKDKDNGVILYKKISEDPIVSKEIFGELFNNAKDNYVIPLSKAILSNEKLSEKIKQKNPEINSLTLISDVNDSYVYTDSGNSNSFTTSFVSSESSVMFSTKSGQNKFIYSYTVLDDANKVAVVQDSICSKQLVDVLDEALLFVSKYPKALTAEQLLNNFETEYSTQYGAKIYEEKIDGIKYYVQVMNNNGNRTIRIAVE